MRRVNEYERVKQLPINAMTVQEYADNINLTTQALYNQIRRNKNISYKIVIFKGFNFIIPS